METGLSLLLVLFARLLRNEGCSTGCCQHDQSPCQKSKAGARIGQGAARTVVGVRSRVGGWMSPGVGATGGMELCAGSVGITLELPGLSPFLPAPLAGEVPADSEKEVKKCQGSSLHH